MLIYPCLRKQRKRNFWNWLKSSNLPSDFNVLFKWVVVCSWFDRTFLKFGRFHDFSNLLVLEFRDFLSTSEPLTDNIREFNSIELFDDFLNILLCVWGVEFIMVARVVTKLLLNLEGTLFSTVWYFLFSFDFDISMSGPYFSKTTATF